MARRNNPDTTTLAILAGGAALVFLLGRKKTDAPAAQPPAQSPPPSETIVAVEEPVSIVAQGEVAVQQPPVVSIPESTPVLENTGTVSLSSGGAPAVLLLNDQRTNYDVPSVPAAVQVKLPVGQVILRLQYADGTQSVRRPVVVVQGLTKEVVIMSPIPTRSAGGVGSNPTGNIQVIAPDAGLLVVNGTVSNKAVPAAPRTFIFPYQPQNGRYDISLQIMYPDGVLSEKASVRVVSGQTVNVSIPPRLYSNTPQGLINLNQQSLTAFNPNLVGGRLSAIGTAVNNKTDSGTGTVSITSDADGFLCNTTNTSQRNAISANTPYNVTTPPQTITFTVLYPNGTMAPAKTVTIVSGQTQRLTFSKPSGLFGGIGTAANNNATLGNGLSLFGLGARLSASGGAVNNNTATLSIRTNADGVVAYGGVIATISPSTSIVVARPPQPIDAAIRFNDGTSAQWSGTLVAGQTTNLYFTKGTSQNFVMVRTNPTPAT